MGLYNDLIFTEAVEQVCALLDTTNPDEVTHRIEELAKDHELSMVCMMLLYLKTKGVDISQINGIELANIQPTIADLIIPPGAKW